MLHHAGALRRSAAVAVVERVSSVRLVDHPPAALVEHLEAASEILTTRPVHLSRLRELRLESSASVRASEPGEPKRIKSGKGRGRGAEMNGHGGGGKERATTSADPAVVTSLVGSDAAARARGGSERLRSRQSGGESALPWK